MIEKIKGITIHGRCFEPEKRLKLYPNKNDRISIVYGKNGSGKSTISDGFTYIISNESINDLSASFFDEQEKPVILSEDVKVFVFNEKYIDKNVKINSDGLGTIVLLGEQVALQKEIDLYERQKKESENLMQNACDTYQKYIDRENPLCPEYHKERIKSLLKDNGWAEVDSIIRGNKVKSSVTETVIKEICMMKVDEDIDQLEKEFMDKKNIWEKTSELDEAYLTHINNVHYTNGFERSICDLINKKIEKPVLTEREQLIMKTIEAKGIGVVNDIQNVFSDPATNMCPCCYRPITDEYKDELLLNIKKVLNKDVDLHKKELESVTFPIIHDDYTVFLSLDAELVQEIEAQKKLCEDMIERYKTEIVSKEDNIFLKKDIDLLGLESGLQELNGLLEKLEKKRSRVVKAAEQRNDLKADFILINKNIAHLRVKSYYEDYNRQKLEQERAYKEQMDCKEKYDETVRYLKELKDRKSNTVLAIKNINTALEYIFFSKGRLSIELRENKYYLKSNGQDVKPKNISLGERNIIGLCYFFTQILSNQDIRSLYKDEEFIVIDDPVSSFDFENKIGIISFIRYQIDKIIKGNQNSKVLILSHDLTTVFDLQKAMGEICKSIKGIANRKPTSFITQELTKLGLVQFGKNRNEYGILLKRIYHYANEGSGDDNFIIGNVMRRVLEAFSTFLYHESIENISCNKNILNVLGNHSIYFNNLMYRLVLHGESHYEEQVYSLNNNSNFFEFISDNEKQRTAKDILCFMYCLNPYHIRAYLKTENAAIKNIEQWIEKIPKNDYFTFKSNKTPYRRTVKLFLMPLSAGTGNDIFYEESAYEMYDTDNEKCDFALHVSGDSMEPKIPNGSIVLIKQCSDLDNGKIGAFFYNGEVFCKKIKIENGDVYLVSENCKYEKIKVDNDSFRIYGEIIEIISKEA